jgi:hypothetical protein
MACCRAGELIGEIAMRVVGFVSAIALLLGSAGSAFAMCGGEAVTASVPTIVADGAAPSAPLPPVQAPAQPQG